MSAPPPATTRTPVTRAGPAAGASPIDPGVTATPRVWPGAPYPLGATFNGSGTNFAVFSEVADRGWSCACSTLSAPRPRWS